MSGLQLKVKGFRRTLLNWYRKHRRELPWRDAPDPYVVWVSEIMLQQTRVDQGTPYIARFLNAFPNVEVLADAPLDRVLKLWEGLGYYTRARNLHKAAKIIVSERDGMFPRAASEWRRLPGVGRYTAGAIASIAFKEQTPVVDGNVKRVLARLTNLNDSIDDATVTESLWALAAEMVKGRNPGDFNQAMMELGAEVCTPRNPQCTACPVQRHCVAFLAGTQNVIPRRTARKKTPHYEIVVAAIAENGRYLLGKRPENGLLGGLWELPGGKVQPGETHQTALAREVREELGVEVSVEGLVACVNHAYTHFKVTLNVYKCRPLNGAAPIATSHTELKWVSPKKFPEFAFPKANHKFLHLL